MGSSLANTHVGCLIQFWFTHGEGLRQWIANFNMCRACQEAVGLQHMKTTSIIDFSSRARCSSSADTRQVSISNQSTRLQAAIYPT
eukprot:3725487-Amphidinium_carterae.1